MAHRYIPILRWKRGERVGLRNVTQAGRQDVVPMFILGTGRYVSRERTASRPAVTAADVIVTDLETAWGMAPFYLDASALSHTAGRPHPLIDIAKRARATGLALIPATRVTAPQAYQQAVVTVAQADHRGVAVRVDLQGLTSASTWTGVWPIPLNETDLIADFTDNIAVVAALGASVDHAFTNLHNGGRWRTVTTVGTSMPDNFSGYRAGIYTIPRAELQLWQRLLALRLPYRIDYGDYATVPINPPPEGIAWGFPINVKYTLEQDFLIGRGVGTTGFGGVDMDQQLIGHAKSIVGYRTRNPLLHCWGDTKIDSVAVGTDRPGNLETWVQIGVNRHIELMRGHLP